MSAICWMLAALIMAPTAEPTSLLGSLPADGTWSRYAVTIEEAGATYNVTWITRSVGKLDYDGRPCRWIELEQQSDSLVYPPLVYRLLIPEASFGKGQNPYDSIVKAWVKVKQLPPREIADLESYDPRLALVLAGPDANLHVEKEPKKVTCGDKTLECHTLRGERRSSLEGFPLRVSQQLLTSEAVPFRMAGFEQEFYPANGNDLLGAVKSTLVDFGQDAKPALPELMP